MKYRFDIPPKPKPRMTRGDRWKKRPIVLEYWKWCDALRGLTNGARFVLPDCGFRLVFHIEMPPSWSKKKRNAMRGTPHQVKPDSDNLLKAVFDALNKKDQSIWDYRVTKVWDDEAFIEVIMGDAWLN
jgi:Holliday junction resolvase RusA-like endonuclease